MNLLAVGTVNKDIKCKRKFCRQPCSYYFEECLMFYQVFLPAQMERNMIMTTGIYELSHGLANDLRLKFLGN